MVKTSGQCVICSQGPTIRAHIIPRALCSDVKGEHRTLAHGHWDSDGYKLVQNGLWDDNLLCRHHEEVVGGGDEYAIDLVRRRLIPAALTKEPAFNVSNPEPGKLSRFIYATVWHHVRSRYGKRDAHSLGPYEARILKALLEGESFNLATIVGHIELRSSRGSTVRLAMHPHYTRFAGLNAWHFAVAGLDCYLITDNRPLPQSMSPFVANDRDPILVHKHLVKNAEMVPAMREVLGRMMKGPDPRRFAKP